MDGFTFASNILTFIANVIASLAWPAVAIVLLYLLRPQLSDLAERLRELTLPGTKAVFSEKLGEAREKFEKIEVTGDAAVLKGGDVAVIEGTVTAAPEDDPYLRLAKDFPEAAILYSFKEIEQTLLTYNALFPKAPPRRNLSSIVSGLFASGLISKEIRDMFRAVQETRNAAVHANASTVTSGEAMEYRTLCRFLAEEFREAIKKVSELMDALKPVGEDHTVDISRDITVDVGEDRTVDISRDGAETRKN